MLRAETQHFYLQQPSRSTCIMHSLSSAMPSEKPCAIQLTVVVVCAPVNKLNLSNLADGNGQQNPGRLVNAALPL